MITCTVSSLAVNAEFKSMSELMIDQQVPFKTHKHTHSQSRQERAQSKLKSRHSLSVLFPTQSFSSSVLLARQIIWRTTFRSISLFLQGLQALVEPFDAQCHIVTRDSHSRGSIEVRTGVFLRVRHETAERVSADGLLLAQRYYPGNVWKTNNEKYWTWQEITSITITSDVSYSLDNCYLINIRLPLIESREIIVYAGSSLLI